MKVRSSHNWKSKSGTWDALNVSFVEFATDYPEIYATQYDFQTVTNCNDYKNISKQSLISMFVDDYILERYWNNPQNYVERYSEAAAVMSPDFSILVGMPAPMVAWNVYRNRLCGYVWQQAGINVIPTVSWSDKQSFKYCFAGIKQGSIVAVSNVGCRNDIHKGYFDAGFYEMINVLQPKNILFMCNDKYKAYYTEPNIVYIEPYFNTKRKQWAADQGRE